MAGSRVGILVFDDVEVLDFCGPFEVFSLSFLAKTPGRDARPAYEVCLISEGGSPVRTRGRMVVETDYSVADCPPLDVLVVPGGQGTRKEVTNRALLDWIIRRSSEVGYLTSVCTGSFLLAEAGLLDGKTATTHWLSLARMQEAYPVGASRSRIPCRDGRSGIHVCRHIGGHRHVAARRGGRPGGRCRPQYRTTNGVSVSGLQ